jgi:membrane protein YqaA with SNARE-associated domain
MFFTAFCSATLLPMGSEAVLVYNVIQGYSLYLLFIIAVLGNTLGAYVNYYLGYKGEEYLVRKKILKEEKIENSKNYFDKYGGYSLLLSWVPVFGDGFTFIAGILRYNLFKFFIYVFIAKFMRYFVLLVLYYNFEKQILEYLGL